MKTSSCLPRRWAILSYSLETYRFSLVTHLTEDRSNMTTDCGMIISTENTDIYLFEELCVICSIFS